jgi:hypothetical protein
MIMIDLEGTLSDHSARLATLLANEEKYKGRDRESWKKYYKGLLQDPPRGHIMDLVHEYIDSGIRPIIYSTRFVNKYNHERQWLEAHDLFEKVELIQRQPHQTKIKGPDLVVQWVRHYDPAIVVDDREEVRDKIRELHRGIMAYSPNAFLQIEGESDEHPLQE